VKAPREFLEDVTIVRPGEREHVRDSVDVSEFDAPEPWLERASDLLAEDDPGPTPFLVAELLVGEAIAAIAGRWKSWKTWLEFELVLSIVTGRDAFGRFAVPDPGPVILVLEESGRDALHRRLGALARGNAIAPVDLADSTSPRTSASAWTISTGRNGSGRRSRRSGRAPSSSIRSLV
jgi:AAA domain